MTTYVLVHGAWHGGWCWRHVAARLRAAGHEVHTPTLTGLGERAHLAGPEIGLRTHIDDLSGLLTYEDLRDVVLVGHSYAGLVVREAADRMPERVARITMVDAWAGRDGESLDDVAPGFFRDWIESVTVDGLVPPAPAATVGVTEPDQVAWLESKLTPHPRRTFSQPTRLSGAVDAIPCRAVLCTPGGPMPFVRLADEHGWAATVLDVGHDAMVTAPRELADVFLQDACGS
ncbi:alpha/beta fold hydrolase [Actinomadura luteofluorescens]|uniref:alpha/beta fold hydrolase n=1 Tax=Actinomadura luteofluorescens TaxID=46163 RepID=UPI002164CF63|nr:alpha/beta hydrolase family protein [Actinomadura glauciflava]MCR3742315.1 Alpha/beta hydrolase family protein [Actinomadura glauciflava]